MIIPQLKSKGISDDDIEKIKEQVQNEFDQVLPPQIALIGFTGVGKSSTINALFNAGQKVSDVRACTQEEKAIFGNVAEYVGSKGLVKIYDMPGLGEDIDADEKHLQTYSRVIPNVDVVVWTFQAGDRQMAPMQKALLDLKKTHGEELVKKLVFVINKADLTAPGETAWNTDFNMPSSEQKKNMDDAEKYIREKIIRVFPKWDGEIISYSAKKRYHLDQLMTMIIQSVPKKRRWVYGQIADVADFTELINPRYLDYIQSWIQSRK